MLRSAPCRRYCTHTTMESSVLILLSLTAALGFAAWQAWRIGNEHRDVALLGSVAGLLGVGAGVAAVV